MKKWNGTCHVFQVDTSNGKTWKPLCDTSAGLTVQISGIFFDIGVVLMWYWRGIGVVSVLYCKNDPLKKYC